MWAIKRKWATMRTSRRLVQLWEDYKSNLGQFLHSSKRNISLNAFLDEFIQSIPDESKLSTFGGCWEVLDYFLYQVSQWLESEYLHKEEGFIVLLNKLLTAVEIILRDETCREYCRDLPKLVDHLIFIFESIDDDNSRVLALRVIASMNLSLEKKVEICKREEFKRMLELLVDKNQDLAKEIIRTVKCFLGSQETAEKQENTPISSRIIGVISDIAKLAMHEISRVLPNEEKKEKPSLSLAIESKVFPPTEKDLRLAKKTFEERWSQQTSVDDDDLKEFMRVQGILGSITQALKQANRDVQTDMMETLYMLLKNNSQNKLEFGKLNGYDYLADLFCTIGPEDEDFVTRWLGILTTIILDDEGSAYVGNPQAFSCIFKIAATWPQLSVVTKVFAIIKEILTLSWENVLPMILDDLCLDYISTCLCRLTVADPSVQGLVPLEMNSSLVDGKEKVSVYDLFRELMLYTSCIAGSFWEQNYAILAIYSDVIDNLGSVMDRAMHTTLVDDLSVMIADINARCPITNSLLDKGTFLGTMSGLERAADAIVSSFFQWRENSYQLLGHLVNYELLYAEMLLSSSLAIDTRRSSMGVIAENREILLEILKDSGKDDISWLLERLLIVTAPCFDVQWVLIELLQAGNFQAVINVLMMNDFRNIRKFRSKDVRKSFMAQGGREFILNHLPDKEIIHLLIAATCGNKDLKSLDLSEIQTAKYIGSSKAAIHCLFELATEEGFIEKSGYLGKMIRKPAALSNFKANILKSKLLFEKAFDGTGEAYSTNYSSDLSSSHYALEMVDPSGLSEIRLLHNRSLMAVILGIIDSKHTISILFILRELAKNAHNRRVLYKMQVARILMKLLPVVPNEHTNAVFELLKTIFSYAVSANESVLLLEFVKQAEYKTQTQDLISYCLKSFNPNVFYSVENHSIESETLSNLPKMGYTLLFWMRLDKNSDSIIFEWQDRQKGVVLLQVAYRNEERSLSRTSSCGQISPGMNPRTQRGGASVEIRAFSVSQIFFPSTDNISQFDVDIHERWAHFALSQNKSGVILSVNGKECSTYKCGYGGGTKAQISGSFGGNSTKAEYTGVTCVEGAIDQQALDIIVANGFNEPVVLENKMIFTLPQETPIGLNLSQMTEVVNEKAASNLSEMPVDTMIVKDHYIFSRSSISEPSENHDPLHVITSLREAMAKEICKFLNGLSEEFSEISFEIVCNLLTRSVTTYEHFVALNGWAWLADIVRKNDLKGEVLELIFRPLLNNLDVTLRSLLSIHVDEIPGFSLERLEGLPYLYDIMVLGNPDASVYLLESLSNMMYKTENIRVFLANDGANFLLDLLHSMEKPEHHKQLSFYLLSLFEHCIPHFTQEDIESMLDFISNPSYERLIHQIEEELVAIISLLCIHMVTGTVGLMDKFIAAEGLSAILGLLKCSSENIKVAVVKMMGLFIGKSQKWYRDNFLKKKYQHLLVSKLSKDPIFTSMTMAALWDLAINAYVKVPMFYPPDSSVVQTIINRSMIADLALPDSDRGSKPELLPVLQNPECLEIILKLLTPEVDEHIKIQFFTMLENHLTPENCDKLLETPFIVWLSVILKHRTLPRAKNFHEDELSILIFEIINKLTIFDLNRNSKQFQILKIFKKLQGPEFLQAKILEGVLSYLERTPDLRDRPDVTPSVFLKNLVLLFQMDEIIDTNIRLCFKVMTLINLLFSHNAELRPLLKTLGYMDIRDMTLIQLIRIDMRREDRILMFQNFSFGLVSQHNKFRESCAILYFIKILIESRDDPELQEHLLRILREEICGESIENRKYLRRMIEFKNFCDFIFDNKPAENEGNLRQCFSSMKNRNAIEEDEPAFESQEEALEWLNAGRGATILQQIVKALNTTDQTIKKQREKLGGERMKKWKTVHENQQQEKASIQKMICEIEIKILQRKGKSEERCFESFKSIELARNERLNYMSNNC